MSTGIDFVFLSNKAACAAHGARQIERHVWVYLTRSCQASKAPSVGRVAPLASTRHDFVLSANKALVWRCCAWWAIAMGPVLPAGPIASQQSGWMLWTRSTGVDRTRFRSCDTAQSFSSRYCAVQRETDEICMPDLYSVRCVLGVSHLSKRAGGLRSGRN